jgi:hypothetical protein
MAAAGRENPAQPSVMSAPSTVPEQHAQQLNVQSQVQQPPPGVGADGVHPAVVAYFAKLPEDYLFDLMRGCIAVLHASLEVRILEHLCLCFGADGGALFLNVFLSNNAWSIHTYIHTYRWMPR